jgi:hypothetical protein
MLSKINFTYKKGNQDHKKEKILKQLRTRARVNLNDTKSLNNSLDLTNKVDNHKILNVKEIVSQTKESANAIVNINNNNIELKINDKIIINTTTINELNNYEVENIDEDTYNGNNKVVIHHNLYDSKSVNTKFIHTIALNDKPFTEEMLSDRFATPYNVERIRNKGIKIINNVYQSKYNYGRSNCTGLGDFIRGCYFILEFCDEHRFEAKIVFNNHIAKFLKIKTHNLGLITNVLSSIQFFKNNNFSKYNIQNGFILDPERDNKNIMADFVNYVMESPSYYGNVFTFCNSFPRNTIPEKNKEYMRKFLEPIDEIKMLIKQTLDELQLRLKGYTVIHIRSGDAFLKNENNNGFNSAYIHKLIKNIIFDVRYITENNPGIRNNYLLIADNNNIKNLLKEKFPAFKMLVKPITHFGEGVVLEEERVKNTLIDFYLLSFANYIMSYSAYEHGSGFSYWCAKTFDVPYTCKYIV